MPAEHEEVLGKLETQVDDLLKQLDDVIKLHAAPGAPHSDDAAMTGAGKHNLSGHKRNKQSKHDQQPKEDKYLHKAKKKADDEEDDGDDDDMGKLAKLVEAGDVDGVAELLAKAKKKSSDDEENDDDEDDWSEPANSKTKKALDADDDESVVIEGQRIAKSEVGEAPFAILKAMSDRLDSAQEEIQKAKDDAEMERLRKRADSDFQHLPGTVDERARMLKAIGALPKEVRGHFEKVITNAEKIAKAAFTTIGTHSASIEDIRKNGVSFDTKVAEIKKRDNCTRTEALEKARKEDPEGFEAYQGRN